jgi:hypothetical protein
MKLLQCPVCNRNLWMPLNSKRKCACGNIVLYTSDTVWRHTPPRQLSFMERIIAFFLEAPHDH